MLAIVLLMNIGAWFRKNRALHPKPVVVDPEHLASLGSAHPHAALSSRQIGWSLAILVALMFSKFFYLASLMSYYTFYLMNKFHLTVQNAQLHLFLFLGAVAAGTFIGGPVGDRVGRKLVIWCSILGVLPFTLILPYANLAWTGILSVVIGLILASAFSAILVYAQELMPGRIAGRSHQHGFRLPRLRVSSGDWHPDGVPAGPRPRQGESSETGHCLMCSVFN